MVRTPRRYTVHLHLSGGQSELVHFQSLEAFQQWYGSVLTASPPDSFVTVPLADLEGEYLVLRPSSVLALRVEPEYGGHED
jgi:hypothetical protein